MSFGLRLALDPEGFEEPGVIRDTVANVVHAPVKALGKRALRSSYQATSPRRPEVIAMMDASSRSLGAWVGRWMLSTWETASPSRAPRNARTR